MAAEDEVFMRFATPSARRQWLGEQLRSLVALAKSTGQLARVFLGGSCVTSKEVLNDLDVLRVMGTGFAVETLPAPAQVKRGVRCQRHYEDQSLQCTMLLSRARVASICMSDCWGNCREHVASI